MDDPTAHATRQQAQPKPEISVHQMSRLSVVVACAKGAGFGKARHRCPSV